MLLRRRTVTFALLLGLAPIGAGAADAPQRQAWFGDLHVHTQLSTDAYTFGTRSTPDDAYRYAQGEAIDHPAGFKMKLRAPLDFYAVTDHAEFMGMLYAMADPDNPLSKVPDAEKYTNPQTPEARGQVFRGAGPILAEHYKAEDGKRAVRSAWQMTIDAAERHNKPGKFTTFIGYEYTSAPQSNNLHRNVIFRNKAADLPFSRVDSFNPEELWAWMDRQRQQGSDLLSIPHNSNGSNGRMFEMTTFTGDPLTAAYAELRMRNEPVVEVTQVKGTSDTHPFLSTNDEWADFEIMPYRIATWLRSKPEGSYARDAYLRGLLIEQQSGFNPYRFGLVGASDTHNGATSDDEANYFSKVGVLDGTPERRGSVPVAVPSPGGMRGYAETYYRFWSASGLTGVWAEENTREAIFDAFRRKETFATSGPRIRVRFFAGFGLPDTLAEAADPAAVAYAGGVPMGGDLVATGADATPRFFVWAMRDAASVALQRVQVIKGWVADGRAQERVFDVACSDGLTIDAATHRCPDNEATVDAATCAPTPNKGAAELRTVWRDPEFRRDQRAFYYVRVLENPTCRWSTWDAVRAGTPPRLDVATTIQERAWSSPIWYRP